MKILNAIMVLMVLVLMISVIGCKEKEAPKTETEAEKPGRVIDLAEVTTVMTVKAIDLPHRLFTLDYGDGNEIVVEAAPDLDGIEKIKVGDKVSITYLTSTAVYVTSPDDDRPAVTSSRSVEVDSKDGKPRKFTVNIVEKTSTVEAIDLATRKATLKDHEGKIETIVVSAKFENLENVKVGDQVVYVYTEAIAVDITKVEE